jgi:hypothetical protein
VEEKGSAGVNTTIISQDKQQEGVLVGLAEPKDSMALSDPLDTIFALAYKNLEPGAS